MVWLLVILGLSLMLGFMDFVYMEVWHAWGGGEGEGGGWLRKHWLIWKFLESIWISANGLDMAGKKIELHVIQAYYKFVRLLSPSYLKPFLDHAKTNTPPDIKYEPL